MNSTFRFSIIVVLVISFYSCDKVLLGPDPEHDPEAVFVALWEGIDERYSFFAEKQINWDSLREVYQPLVAQTATDQALFKMLADLLFELRDGHTNLTTPFDQSRNWEWFLNYPPNFSNELVEQYYLRNNFQQLGPFRLQTIDSVLYVYYPDFGESFSEDQLDILVREANSQRGLVLDIRHNSGGSLRLAERLAATFCAATLPYARTRYKTGKGRADFSDWETAVIQSRQAGVYSGKLALLTNRRCYSAANTFAHMISLLPQTIIIGDRTGGGGGSPAYAELPNGWTYRCSATQTVTLSGEQLEFGLPVDIPATLTFADETLGRDPIIDRALAWVKE